MKRCGASWRISKGFPGFFRKSPHQPNESRLSQVEHGDMAVPEPTERGGDFAPPVPSQITLFLNRPA